LGGDLGLAPRTRWTTFVLTVPANQNGQVLRTSLRDPPATGLDAPQVQGS
jgi:hypothetical protein